MIDDKDILPIERWFNWVQKQKCFQDDRLIYDTEVAKLKEEGKVMMDA